MTLYIIVIALIIFLEIKFDFFTKNFKKIFKEKSTEKIIVFSVLIFIIIFSASLGSNQIAKFLKYNPKYVGKPLFKNFYGPYLYFKFLFLKVSSKNPTLNNIYLINTAIFCLLSTPILLYMAKKSDNDLDTHGSARWATISEWEEAGLISPPGKFTDGVILGIVKKRLFGKVRYIIENLKTHIALIAPSRAGKGTGVIIPTLLNWLGSVFVLDMKGENYQITAGYRKHALKQTILKFKPYGLEDSISYNPLAEVRIGTAYEVKDATIIADILTDPGEGKKRDHWDMSATALFIGLILHVLYMRRREGKIGTFGDIVDFLTLTDKTLEQNFIDLMEYKHLEDYSVWNDIYDSSQMKGINSGTHPIVARTAAEILNKDERERASVISTVMAKLSLFKDPIIRKNTSRADFRIKDLMDYKNPVSFYIVVEAEQMDTLSLLLRILVTQTIGILAPEMDFSSDKPIHKHKMLFLMDEFPAFGTIPLFEKALAYIAGYGMKALIIAQALNQIKKNYGDRNSVFDNCATTVFYSPTPLDTETPKQISEMLGDKTIKVKNRSYKAFQIGSSNISESNQARRLLTPEEVRNKVAGKWNIISVTGLYPRIGVKLEYFREKYFKSKTHKVYGIPKTDYLTNEILSDIKTINTTTDFMKEEEDNKLDKRIREEFLENIESENIELEDIDEIDDFEDYETTNEERDGMLNTLYSDEGLVDPEEDF
ncbi:type IV secretory system conjugative DNA transfer family protein [Fusobacterium sp. CM1]|uniref:type IV secretory system conjugative DNA transfer family protein n=1 Tax=Fusobacterium sp. CM1 TaxID=936561 RepID=UPI000446DC44|nr:type IV secretory system conjugative DNA transfer family protein [Fusobacterium sp. CM1]EUB35025.1 type IV secretory system Conjugative DNA transfer [Fusobacterium sp. CM1]